eukprot:15452976-Alexandrium_andersonii.AAC.1
MHLSCVACFDKPSHCQPLDVLKLPAPGLSVRGNVLWWKRVRLCSTHEHAHQACTPRQALSCSTSEFMSGYRCNECNEVSRARVQKQGARAAYLYDHPSGDK